MEQICTERNAEKIMKKETIYKIINEEIENVKWGKIPLKEELESSDIAKLRSIIRAEVSAIFFDLFKKRKSWGG